MKKIIPFNVGDLVRYIPTARTKGWENENPQFGLKSGNVYRIKEIIGEGYLCFYEGHKGSHFSNFAALGPEGISEVVEALPFPSREERATGRLEKLGIQVGDKLVFSPNENDRTFVKAIKGIPLVEGETYTVSGFDQEALGCYLKEVATGPLPQKPDGSYPVGWFKKIGGIR